MIIESLEEGAKRLEVKVKSAARSVKHNVNITSLFLKQRATEYLLPLQKQLRNHWQGFKLANEIRKLDVPYDENSHYDQQLQEESQGILIWLGSKFRKPVYALPTTIVAVSAPLEGSLVKVTRIVVYQGKPVKLVVATCG